MFNKTMKYVFEDKLTSIIRTNSFNERRGSIVDFFYNKKYKQLFIDAWWDLNYNEKWWWALDVQTKIVEYIDYFFRWKPDLWDQICGVISLKSRNRWYVSFWKLSTDWWNLEYNWISKVIWSEDKPVGSVLIKTDPSFI